MPYYFFFFSNKFLQWKSLNLYKSGEDGIMNPVYPSPRFNHDPHPASLVSFILPDSALPSSGI